MSRVEVFRHRSERGVGQGTWHSGTWHRSIFPQHTSVIPCQSIGLTRSARELWSEHWPDRSYHRVLQQTVQSAQDTSYSRFLEKRLESLKERLRSLGRRTSTYKKKQLHGMGWLGELILNWPTAHGSESDG
eukprot:sb/3475047/